MPFCVYVFGLVCVLRMLTLGCLVCFVRQVAIELAPVTEWLPIKQPPTRPSSSATVADMLGSISIADNSETCNEVKECSQDRATNPPAPSCGTPSASQAWEDKDTATEMLELWRPSPTVARGAAKGETQENSLCEQGILAVQGNLQPMGKVVFILEKNQKEDHVGSLVLSSSLRADGKLSNRDSYVMFHPADKRVPHMLIARGDLPSLFVDVSFFFSLSVSWCLVLSFSVASLARNYPCDMLHYHINNPLPCFQCPAIAA